MGETGYVIRVRGTVQGVGFRPAVWRLAHAMDLAGHVLNDGEGVAIHLWTDDVETFIHRLHGEAPPLSRITGITVEPREGPPPGGPFRIAESAAGKPETAIAPDAATCPECLAEIADPSSRRFGYAFTNCTNCGPRLSIIRAVPYDRAATSMAAFTMCDDCAREYHDPADRRFHAQPIACPACGPRLWLEMASEEPVETDVIAATAALIRAGKIVAIKGIGGIHLACDAANAEAVSRLRQRKQRQRKPFALMARDAAMIRRYAMADEAEVALLRHPAAPIVLLHSRAVGWRLAADVAPGQRSLGFMLPYAPLHHLLLQQLDGPIVLTSGNLSDEPQCIGNDEARHRLGAIADAFCLHDRDIVNRLDDSVVRLSEAGPVLIRRARGYAPAPLPLHPDFARLPPVLGLGADLKSTITLLWGGRAVTSQHVGNLSTPAARDEFDRTIENYRAFYDFHPAAIATDLHPDFHGTRAGVIAAQELGRPVIKVQHHHAHVAACLAENGVGPEAPPVLGIVMDGTGAGSDGTVWGGEFLLAGYRNFERVAHFIPVPLLGGDQAARQPWRNAFAHLSMALGWDAVIHRYAGVEAVARLATRPLAALNSLMASRHVSPLGSSAGRLFDAVAALLGICFDEQDYEGEAASLLEGLAAAAPPSAATYPVDSNDGVLSWRGLFTSILDDLQHGRAREEIARQFHVTLADALASEARRICAARSITRVVLSGGCFVNALLLQETVRRLRASGLDVMTHQHMPPGDGSISLGRSAIAAACLAAAG